MKNKKEIVRGKTHKKSSSGTNRSPKKLKRTKDQIDPKTLQIILGLFVLINIIGFIKLGIPLTLMLDLGILAIIGFTMLFRKFNIQGRKKTTLNIVIIIFLVLSIVVALIGTAFLIYVVRTAPAFDPNLLNTQESSILYDKNGKEFAKLGAKLRENVTYDELPEVLVDAIIATEDSRFFQHNGLDAPRFLKASVQQVLGKDAGGASTLSMQVVKNSYTNAALTSGFKGIARKFTDIYLAIFKLEKNYTKEQIIEFYVNNHLLGMNNWGVQQASQSYFGKDVGELNLAEASLIAGLFQSPNRYYPYKYPEEAKGRQKTVLNLMKRHGYISNEEYNAVVNIPIEAMLTESTVQGEAYQAYIDTVVEELDKKYGVNPYVTSVLVYTNMDAAKQKAFDDIYNGVTYTWYNDKVQSASAAIENSTGKIVAIGAGRNRSGVNSYNFATMTKRQIGSTAKPIFDYGPGIEYENWSTYQLFVDEPWKYSNGPSIKNSDSRFMGAMTLRRALSLSRNIPALKAFQLNNNKNILEFVTNLGITPEVENGRVHEAHSLGSFNGVSPVELAAAYAAFGNKGEFNEPYSVSKLIYRDNGLEKSHEPINNQAMSDATAFMITDILQDSVKTGLASGVRMSGINLAAKTGTTNFPREIMTLYKYPSGSVPDVWVAGYDPEYSLTVWYGYRNNGDGYLNQGHAVTERAKIFKALGNHLFKKNNQNFEVPKSVVRLPIEMGTNPALLASDSTPRGNIVYEYFKVGTEPTETSTTFTRLETPKNLKVSFNNNKARISWSKVALQTGNASYGDFGYKVYFNNTLIGFTTENFIEYNTSSPVGTYKVVTSFEKYDNNQSSPATYYFENTKYTISVVGPSNYTINVGENILDKLPQTYPFKIIRNSDGHDITGLVANSTYVTITNNVDNTSPNTTSKLIFSVDYDDSELKKDITINVTVK